MLLSQRKITDPTGRFGHSWKYRMAGQIVATIAAEEFPCVFSQVACRNQRIQFAFVDDLEPASLARSGADLAAYLDAASRWDGRVSTAQPLIMVFDPERIRGETIEDYHAVGWKMLQYWHDNDPDPWPDGVALDPHSPYWTMCFAGVQIFVNMSNPAHVTRRSRRLCDGLALVINPRERFDKVAGDNGPGRRVRRLIRDRVHAYDGLAHSPVLGSFEAGDIEWRQYGLMDDNESRADRCPFRLRLGAKSSARHLDDADQLPLYRQAKRSAS
jgi:FPC/CPF motif-containing protein YcgG